MKTSVRIRLNQMARIVREKRAVTMAELCMTMDLAPSTLYNYARLMKDIFLDIKFENGVFSTIWDERMEALAKQRTLIR